MSISSVLFYRDFKVASGGHQKVFDYFGHLASEPGYRPVISFSDSTKWNITNPWYPNYRKLQVPFKPEKYDALFLGGMDWMKYQSVGIDHSIPVINIIQHVRHGLPTQLLSKFLTQKAIRICVSKEVENAILDTELVNGPTFTIPNGIKAPTLDSVSRKVDVFISGLKRPVLALTLRKKLEEKGLSVDVENTRILQKDFLDRISAARIALMLPGKTEGFYLPALEAMALADIVVVPDCIGNRGFCVDIRSDPLNGNCFFPSQSTDDIVQATFHAFGALADISATTAIALNAKKTVFEHGLEREKAAFLEILTKSEGLWQEIE